MRLSIPVHTSICDSVPFSLSWWSALNLLWCFKSYLSWWKCIVMPWVALPLLILSLNCWDISPSSCSVSVCAHLQSVPSPLCATSSHKVLSLCHSFVPWRYIKLVKSQCCNIFWNSNQSFQYNAHCCFTVLYEHTLISIVTEREMLCIVDRPMLFCVFDVFQEMGWVPPLSGIVLISQISGRNKSQIFLLIHKACCYLVLFFSTASSLLFTPVITPYFLLYL